MPYVQDPGDWSQVLEELAIEQAEVEEEQYKCRCPRCDRFGVVSGSDDYYGTIYKCSCLLLSWVIHPETGEKVEGAN